MKLIKRGDWLETSDVKPVDWGHPSEIRADTPVRTSSVSPATARLESEVDALRKALIEAETRHQKDLAAKFQQARQDAAAAHRRSDEDALTALSTSLGETASEALDRLGTAEQLALVLCEAVLSRVFSDAASQKGLLVRAIRRQVDQLRADLILAVRVSTADFPEASHVKELQRTLGNQFDIKPDSRLTAGSCRIDLRLGHIDLSLPAHWSALQSELRRLAELEKPT